MAFDYIKEDELYQKYSDAKTFMMPLWQPMDEYERIARNKPHPGIAKELPKVTDGTLAALIQEQPKRVIQQIPTGKVKAPDDWLDVVGDYIFEHEIIPNANSVASLIQKCWAMISKSLTYGSQPAFVQFVNRGEYFGTDFTLPYIKDVLLEPGKLSDRDSNVIFLRTWWTPNQIDAVIDKEKMLGKNAKKRGEDYESGWDLVKLAKLKTMEGQKDVMAMSPNERNKQLNSGFIEIVHCFQRGIGATFYSFSPLLPDKDNVVRRRVNKDPRGIIPIHFMYANVDLSNPLGRGAVEISGGMQNLLDSEVQSYQYMRALLMNPPLKIRGNVSSTILKYAPAQQWRLGVDANADVEPVSLETKSLESFPNNYGLIKSQILNLNSSTDTSISSQQVGSNANSKTPQGVQATEQKLGISDNYIRRQFESVFEEIGETMINLWFAERSGTQDLTLTPEAVEKLELINPKLVNSKNQVRINYDSETSKLQFKVDPTSSTPADNQEQIADLQQLLQETSQNPYIPYLMQAEGKELHLGEAYIQLFERYGMKEIDKIITDIEVDQNGQPVKPPQVMTPFFDKPHLTAVYKDLPPKAQMQLLANGGVTVQEDDVLQPNIDQIAGGRMQNPVQPAYVDPQTGQIISGHPPMGQPYVDPSTGQPVQGEQDYSNHPLIQMMTALQIKFTDLPEDSQKEVLDRLGVPSNQPTPSVQNQKIEATNTAVKVAQLSHQAGVAADTQANAQQQQQLSQQQAQQQADQANQQQQLAQQQADQQAQETQQQNQEEGLTNELRKRGYPDALIGQAMKLIQAGATNAQVIQALHPPAVKKKAGVNG